MNSPSPEPARVLVVDDDREMCALLADLLGEAGHSAATANSGERALAKLDSEPFNLMVTDVRMPGLKGMDLLSAAQERFPHLPVIIITAFGSIESAIEAMKRGAFHYLTKPFRNEEFLHLAELALEQERLRRRVERLQAEVEERYEFANLVGGSPAMRRVYDVIGKVADASGAVLITGESGTGKELVARAIHYHGARKSHPFVPVNCAALPETLLESELFGHVRGAFTGAAADKKGLFEEANHGTLFLDEIGETTPALQGKLLRVLEDGQVRRVGATRSVATDVRVIAATNQELEEEVRGGRFREDLFYRLNVLAIPLPPLRERGDDIHRLAEHCLRNASAKLGRPAPPFSPEVVRLFLEYPWPGNVRELANTVERAVILCGGERIGLPDIPEPIRDWRARRAGAGPEPLLLRDVERAHILQVLEQARGNKSKAADLLGIDRKTLYHKLEQYGAG